MQRYLLHMGYFGTKYNGVTKNLNQKDHYSVEEVLRQALESIKSIKKADIYISSRTDAGVHATNSTLHIDLDKKLPPYVITKQVNSTLSKWHEQIRILKTTPVCNEFDSRRDANCRTYLYRFAVTKKPIPKEISPKIFKSSMFIPIEECYRCFFVPNEDFDIDRAKAAAKLLQGTHDYRSFMKVSKEQKTLKPTFCYRKIDQIMVRKGATLATSINLEKTLEQYDFYEVEFKSKAYFYRQIRNMVGTIIAAGNGRITERDIYEMLTIPSKYSWLRTIYPTSSYGLYLTNVEYPPDVLAKSILHNHTELINNDIVNEVELEIEDLVENQIHTQCLD